MVPGRRVREVAADHEVDLQRDLLMLLHRRLNDLETLRELHCLRELHPELARKVVNGLLREVHRAHARVAAPLALRRVRVEIDRCERELADAARESALRIDVANGLAGPHRDAEDARALHRDRARKRRHVAVVEHLERTLPLLLDAGEEALRQLELGGILLLDTADQGCHAELLPDKHARRRAADRIHLSTERHRGLLKTRTELLVVVLGIGLVARIPRKLLREDDLAALERGDLEVARAEIEADAAAVHVVLHQNLALAHLRHLLERHDLNFDGASVEVAEELEVERARALLRVGLRDRLDDFVRTRQVQFPAACAPEDELDDTLHKVFHARKHRGMHRLRHDHVVAVDVAVLTLPRDCDYLLVAMGLHAQEVQGLERRLEPRVRATATLTFRHCRILRSELPFSP